MTLSRRLFLASLAAAAATPVFAQDATVDLSQEPFPVKDDEKKSGSTYNPYWGGFMPSNDKDTTRRLSKKKPLKFISDSDSGTIIVRDQAETR